MKKILSSKSSGRQMIAFVINGKKYATSHKTLRGFYDEDRYDLDEVPQEIRKEMVRELFGELVDEVEFIYASIIKGFLVLEDVFFTDKEEVEGDNDFIEAR